MLENTDGKESLHYKNLTGYIVNLVDGWAWNSEAAGSNPATQTNQWKINCAGRGTVSKTERSWWNGDRVLKGFRLNEFCFKKGDKFACAGAMKGAISYARQYKRKNIGF